MGYIRARGKHFRLYVTFRFQGKHEEPTKYSCERSGDKNCHCRGCKIARGFLAEVEGAIASRAFRYQDFFPDSKFLEKMGVVNTTPNISFSVYARTWLDYQESILAYSTFRSYKVMLEKLVNAFASIAVREIKPTHIKAFISTLGLSPKSVQNYVGLMSVILNSAVDDDLISKNPCAKVKKPRVVKVKPEPFELSEVISILNWFDEHEPDMTVYFAIAFFTGMRTGEIMGLKWSDINWTDFSITVQRTMTNGRIKESTKTADSRRLDIIESLEPYLIKQKKFTFMKSDFIVTNKLGAPFMKYDNIKEFHYFRALKALGLKERKLYQTRHTFAVMMLKAGEELAWIRDMLGHTDLKQLVERYGNWINKSTGRRGKKFMENVGK